MKKYDIYCGLFWLIMALFVIGTSLYLGLGTVWYPGPGFFPFLVSLFLLCLSLAIIILARRERYKNPDFYEWPSFAAKVPITLTVLLAYAVALEFLGYIIGTLLLLVYLFKVTASRKWWVSILMSVMSVSLTYYFFGILLKAQFPMGFLE